MDYLERSKEDTKPVAQELNRLLAEYHLYYQKLRNFHWNITGPNFFDLHEKFEVLYEDARVSIDEIAERILTLKHQPVSNFSDYINTAKIVEPLGELGDLEMVKQLLNDHGILIDTMNKIAKVAAEHEDEGTIDLIGGYIGQLEKESWMLNSWAERK